jgi:hypothetical protein
VAGAWAALAEQRYGHATDGPELDLTAAGIYALLGDAAGQLASLTGAVHELRLVGRHRQARAVAEQVRRLARESGEPHQLDVTELGALDPTS